MTPLVVGEQVPHPTSVAALDTWGSVEFAFESTDSPDVVVAS